MAQITSFFVLLLASVSFGARLNACNNLRIDSGMCLQLYFLHWFLEYLKEKNPNIEWGTGMSADLDVTSDHDGNGYTLVITWDKPLSSFEQWSGSASSEDQK